MKRSVISDDAVLTFSDYFKLNAYTDEVLAHFGFTFEAKRCDLPMTQRPLDGADSLKSRLNENMPHVDLTNEQGRREFLIAPILMEVTHYVGGQIGRAHV